MQSSSPAAAVDLVSGKPVHRLRGWCAVSISNLNILDRLTLRHGSEVLIKKIFNDRALVGIFSQFLVDDHISERRAPVDMFFKTPFLLNHNLVPFPCPAGFILSSHQLDFDL